MELLVLALPKASDGIDHAMDAVSSEPFQQTFIL
jgi:hypothetical protein